MARLVKKSLMALVLTIAAQALYAAEAPPAVQEAAGARKEELRKMIAGAITEGELNYWDTVIQSTTNEALVAGFRKYYGLPAGFKVNYSLSPAAALVTRVEQEVTAGRVTMDIAAVASLPWVHDKIKGGHVMRYDSPQYLHYKNAIDKGLGQDGYFAFNGAYVFVPMWSADKVNFKSSSWRDVAGAVPGGRISMGDAGKSPTYLATYMGLRTVLDLDYFKRIAQMKPVFLVRSEQIANQIVTGQDLFAFSGMPTRAYQFNERGAKLKFLMPKEGVVLMPQAMFILAKAPHPNAARLWVDYVLSEEGQSVLVKHEALVSGRTGFKSPLPDYAPSIDELNVIKVDWAKITPADMEKARAEWLSVFMP